MKEFFEKHQIVAIQVLWIAIVWSFIKLDVLFLSDEPAMTKSVVAAILFAPTIIHAVKRFLLPKVRSAASRTAGLADPAICLTLGSVGLYGAVTGGVHAQEWRSWTPELIFGFSIARLVVGVMSLKLLGDAYFGMKKWIRENAAAKALADGFQWKNVLAFFAKVLVLIAIYVAVVYFRSHQ